jgi:hypothetical protein
MLTPRRPADLYWIRVPTRAAHAPARAHGFNILSAFRDAISISDFKAPVALERSSFSGALESLGVPATNLSPEQELVELLQAAAEIEHGLMLQYLYATYSLKVVSIAGTLRTIAIEEMGHFVTVQNMLAACRAEPYLGHGSWNARTPFQPFPFKLEPASIGSLAKYTIAEMPDPDSVSAGIRPDLSTLIAQADASARSPVEAHRVGLLYAKIYWLLRQSDDPLPDLSKEPWPGFPVSAMAAQKGLAGRHVRDGFVTDAHGVNALPEQWRGNYDSVIVEPITGRDAALEAVARISAQGEGFGDTPQGHFERFVGLWRDAKASSDLARPAPVNPFYTTGQGAGGTGDEITSVDGRQFARMGDRLYELVLLCTATHLLLPAGTALAVRTKPAKAAVAAMRDCLGSVAGALSSIPLADQGASGRVCGLPFSAPPVEVASNLKAVLDRAGNVIADLQEIVGEVVQADGASALATIAQGVGATLDEEITPRLKSLAGIA